MSADGVDAFAGDVEPLNSSLYKLGDEEKAFFKATTGISGDEQLKRHILAAQAKAYAIRPYPCIHRFAFLGIGITKNEAAYQHLLKLGIERPDALFLDVGCCFGNDVRRAIWDGYPMHNVVTSDLHGEFWQLGHTLFNTTSERFTVPFVAGDIFDPAHLTAVPPLGASQAPPSPRPDIHTLTSLNPLHGHVSAIFASSFFHLFSEAEQLELAKKLAGLLSPQAGSMIFGMHVGYPTKATHKGPPGVPNKEYVLFTHSPESWTEMWDGEVFPKGAVKVEAYLAPAEFTWSDVGPTWQFLRWTVTRV
ncbi:hypothetical protein EVG20_g7081 [Dentipellis fragilis]|uniref:Methyltransferase domain-containing protein n=1 Tax=Dentipellis fragilis TaxID=205917 RepID=A0A4Y9YIV2_9AGAM|nr:hypothetical protein EVG20_g7081 [Dentipellis fragilis]